MNTQRSTFEQFIDKAENRRIYEQERLLVDTTELVSRVMEVTGIKRAELAGKIERSKAYVTQILRGDQNLTLKTLADVFFALNYRLVMVAEPFCGSGYVSVRQWNIGEHGHGVVPAEEIASDESYGVAA